MKIKNWLKIISGDKDPSSKDIKMEIDSLKIELKTGSNTLGELNKSLIETKKQVLGGNGTQADVKALETEISALTGKVEAMSLVIEDLEGILVKTQTTEKAKRLSQINTQLADLAQEEDVLWKTFMEHYSKAAAVFSLIKGRPYNVDPGNFTQPFQWGSERHRALQEMIKTHVGGTPSIPDTKRVLSWEMDKMKV